jgi:hypothetical protein
MLVQPPWRLCTPHGGRSGEPGYGDRDDVVADTSAAKPAAAGVASVSRLGRLAAISRSSILTTVIARIPPYRDQYMI